MELLVTEARLSYQTEVARLQSEGDDLEDIPVDALAILLDIFQWRLPRIVVIDDLTEFPIAYTQVATNILWRDIPLSVQVDQNQNFFGETDDEENIIFQPSPWYGQFHVFDFDVFTQENFDYLQFDPYHDWVLRPTQWLFQEQIDSVLDFVGKFLDEDSQKIVAPPGYCVFRLETAATKKSIKGIFLPDGWYPWESYKLINFAEIDSSVIKEAIYAWESPLKRSIRIFDGNKWHKVRIFDTKFGQKTEREVHDEGGVEMRGDCRYADDWFVAFEIED